MVIAAVALMRVSMAAAAETTTAAGAAADLFCETPSGVSDRQKSLAEFAPVGANRV